MKRLRALDEAFGKDGLNMSKDALLIANTLKDNIRSEAPIGETGNLRRGMVAKNFAKERRNNPGAFVAVDYRIAPHAHLVEHGHITKSGSHTAANPFFSRGVARSASWMRMAIRKMIIQRLAKTAAYKEGLRW